MNNTPNAYFADPDQFQRRAAAPGQRVGSEPEEAEFNAPGAPPKVHEGRQRAGFSGEGEVGVDNAEGKSSPHLLKRKRDVSDDIVGEDRQPKWRCVDDVEGESSPSHLKRQRDVPDDILEEDRQPKRQRVEVGGRQGPPLPRNIAAAEAEADPLPNFITNGFSTTTIHEWEYTASEIALLGGFGGRCPG